MAKAFWAGKMIAESNACVVVEGNQYFPEDAVKKQYLKSSTHTSMCPWKGTAHYYHVEVDGLRSDNAAWFYPEPKPEAVSIAGRILHVLQRVAIHRNHVGVGSGGHNAKFSLFIQHLGGA